MGQLSLIFQHLICLFDFGDVSITFLFPFCYMELVRSALLSQSTIKQVHGPKGHGMGEGEE